MLVPTTVLFYTQPQSRFCELHCLLKNLVRYFYSIAVYAKLNSYFGDQIIGPKRKELMPNHEREGNKRLSCSEGGSPKVCAFESSEQKAKGVPNAPGLSSPVACCPAFSSDFIETLNEALS